MLSDFYCRSSSTAVQSLLLSPHADGQLVEEAGARVKGGVGVSHPDVDCSTLFTGVCLLLERGNSEVMRLFCRLTLNIPTFIKLISHLAKVDHIRGMLKWIKVIFDI